MMACALIAAPKLRPEAGTPPITPGSAVSVSRSVTPSSAATAAMPSGMPMPRLTTAFASQLERRAPGDDLALAHLQRLQRAHGHAHLAGKGGGVELGEGLHVILAPLGDDHAIDQDAGDLDLARVQAAALGDALDLHDDAPAGVVRGHGDRERLQRQRLALHRDVAVGIGGGAAHDGDVDRKRAVEEILRPVDLHQADEVGGRAGVELAAAVPRIGERVEADPGEMAGLAGGDVAVEMGDDALRQVVGLDRARDGQSLQLRHQAPVSADDAPDKSAMGEMVEAALLAVALSRGVDEAQVARLADAVGAAGRAVEKARLERDGDRLRKADADEAAGRNRVPRADEACRLARGLDLALVARRLARRRRKRCREASWIS